MFDRTVNVGVLFLSGMTLPKVGGTKNCRLSMTDKVEHGGAVGAGGNRAISRAPSTRGGSVDGALIKFSDSKMFD